MVQLPLIGAAAVMSANNEGETTVIIKVGKKWEVRR